jgi:hypothetical protein
VVSSWRCIEADRDGVALGREHLGPRRLEILLGESLAHLLHEDQRDDQGESPQDHPDS